MNEKWKSQGLKANTTDSTISLPTIGNSLSISPISWKVIIMWEYNDMKGMQQLAAVSESPIWNIWHKNPIDHILKNK